MATILKFKNPIKERSGITYRYSVNQGGRTIKAQTKKQALRMLSARKTLRKNIRKYS